MIPPGFKHTLGQLLQIVSQALKKALGDDVCQHSDTRASALAPSDMWINCVTETQENLIVGDVRFKLEAKALVDKGGYLLRINGDPVGIRERNEDGRDLNHISETDLDDWPFENVIENTKSIEDLREKVREFLLSVFL